MAVFVLLLPYAGEDLWFRRRVVETIVEQGAVPCAELYSYTASGMPWVNHEWLAQVVYAVAFVCGGPVAVSLLFPPSALHLRIVHAFGRLGGPNVHCASGDFSIALARPMGVGGLSPVAQSGLGAGILEQLRHDLSAQGRPGRTILTKPALVVRWTMNS